MCIMFLYVHKLCNISTFNLSLNEQLVLLNHHIISKGRGRGELEHHTMKAYWRMEV